mmetsp:Transcript_13672/g.20048  ORF Transcript_13672/g.20048 Transcript_13672/m.20048 type:complete len:82 (-) Transcript_13672:112-357(-)
MNKLKSAWSYKRLVNVGTEKEERKRKKKCLENKRSRNGWRKPSRQKKRTQQSGPDERRVLPSNHEDSTQGLASKSSQSIVY